MDVTVFYDHHCFCMVLLCFQESPMPEPSELFTNVYVKGYGVEVIFISLVDTHSHTLFYSIITVGLNEAYRFF